MPIEPSDDVFHNGKGADEFFDEVSGEHLKSAPKDLQIRIFLILLLVYLEMILGFIFQVIQIY